MLFRIQSREFLFENRIQKTNDIPTLKDIVVLLIVVLVHEAMLKG